MLAAMNHNIQLQRQPAEQQLTKEEEAWSRTSFQSKQVLSGPYPGSNQLQKGTKNKLQTAGTRRRGKILSDFV